MKVKKKYSQKVGQQSKYAQKKVTERGRGGLSPQDQLKRSKRYTKSNKGG